MKLSEPSPRSARTIPNVTEEVEIVPRTKFPIKTMTKKSKKPMVKTIFIVSDVLPASLPAKRKTGAIKNGINKKDNKIGSANKAQSTLYFHVIWAARLNSLP